MSDAVSVVISVAGLGTRLGLSRPKALVEIAGKPILQHQLEMLEDVEHVIIVAGYKAQSIVELVRELRPNALIALNHEFHSTGTAASLKRGAFFARDTVVSLDGDLLVRRQDFLDVLNHNGPCIGVVDTSSDEPVCVDVDSASGLAVGLSQKRQTATEWSGLVKLEREKVLQFGDRHVFEGVRCCLPIATVAVDSVEVDYPHDLQRAHDWMIGQASGR